MSVVICELINGSQQDGSQSAARAQQQSSADLCLRRETYRNHTRSAHFTLFSKSEGSHDDAVTAGRSTVVLMLTVCCFLIFTIYTLVKKTVMKEKPTVSSKNPLLQLHIHQTLKMKLQI